VRTEDSVLLRLNSRNWVRVLQVTKLSASWYLFLRCTRLCPRNHGVRGGLEGGGAGQKHLQLLVHITLQECVGESAHSIPSVLRKTCWNTNLAQLCLILLFFYVTRLLFPDFILLYFIFLLTFCICRIIQLHSFTVKTYTAIQQYTLPNVNILLTPFYAVWFGHL
jgi:hypothetical protein